MKALTLKMLRDANIERNKQWDSQGTLHPIFRALELGGETGELMNMEKKLSREEMGLRGSRISKEQLEDEAADVLICLDLYCMSRGLDLGAATVRKFNATSRKYGLTTTLPEDREA